MQRATLDLAHALARAPEFLADLIERPRFFTVETEAQLNDAPFLVMQLLERMLDFNTGTTRTGHDLGPVRIRIFDEIGDLRVPFADLDIERNRILDDVA